MIWMKLRIKVASAIWLAVAIAALYGIGYLAIGRSFVPDNFTVARKADAEIAKSIVALTEESLKNLESISALDREYKFEDALVLVRQELLRTNEVRENLGELLGEIGKMTVAADGIAPAKARNLAIEAIKYQLDLVKNLNEYNAILNGLLATLEWKFAGIIKKDVADVQVSIGNMNAVGKEINKLNNLFNQKMEEFDAIVK